MVEEGRVAPDFELETDSGERVRLLADPDHAVSERYGVWREKRNYGKTYMGIERSTFMIDAGGTVVRAMRRVKPDTHAQLVLQALAT